MPRAEVYVPLGRAGWWGGVDKRHRCAVCGKVILRDEEHAKKSVAAAEERGQPTLYYRGRCGHLHLARDKKRRLQDQT